MNEVNEVNASGVRINSAFRMTSFSCGYTCMLACVCFHVLDRCQTYEGGFGGCPGLEAHGGYSFCGLAALLILNFPSLCNLQQLLVRRSG